MKTESPSERAIALLKIHHGSCFILEGNDLAAPFREMEEAGLVTIADTKGEVCGITIHATNFTPVVLAHDDESPAH